MDRPIEDSDENDEDRVVMGSVRMSVCVVDVVMTSTLVDEDVDEEEEDEEDEELETGAGSVVKV